MTSVIEPTDQPTPVDELDGAVKEYPRERLYVITAVVLAAKGESELAISVVKNSVSQIAAFLYPLLVLVSLLTASHLTFALPPLWAGALILTAILIWQITGDGEATLFEGAALVAMYIVLATVAAFEH